MKLAFGLKVPGVMDGSLGQTKLKKGVMAIQLPLSGELICDAFSRVAAKSCAGMKPLPHGSESSLLRATLLAMYFGLAWGEVLVSLSTPGLWALWIKRQFPLAAR